MTGSFYPKLNDYLNNVFSQYEYTEAEQAEYSEGFYEMHSQFFKDCWIAAGGEKSRVPTFLAFDKEYQYRDFLTGEIFDDQQLSQKLGFKYDTI